MRIKLFAILSLFIAFFCVDSSEAQTPFVLIKLDNGLSFNLPKNWLVFDSNTKTTLEASVASRFTIDVSSNLPFAANLYNSRNQTIAMVNVRVYPQMDIHQHEVVQLTDSQISEFDDELKQNITKGVASSGARVTTWYGTEKIRVRNKIFLLSKYRRTSAIQTNTYFRVSLMRLLHGKHSFTLTLSYNETEEYLLRPIIEYMMKTVSIR